MRKHITKRFLGKENRYMGTMLSKAIVSFIFRKKINLDVKQISYDEIEFMNVFSTEFIDLNTNNFFFGIKYIVSKNGKRIEFNMIYCKGDHIDFLLGETEVTQELYELVMGYNPSKFKGESHSNSSQRPVESVTWYDAIMFCNKLSELQDKNLYYEINNIEYHNDGKSIKEASVKINEKANGFRLPLSKEWVSAAKAGTNNQYAGTNDKSKLEEYAWFGENGNSVSTHPVATKKPNEWGFYDMTGNVREWCWDKTNLLNTRFIHGGSRIDNDKNLCSIVHNFSHPLYRHNFVGFRVSASLVNRTIESLDN